MKIVNVTKKIKDFYPIKNVSFEIKKNKITAFVGDNGAGKTTTIKSIFGELKLESGEFYFFDGTPIKDNLNKIAFFPDSNNIPLDLTVEAFIYYSALISGIPDNTIKERSEIIMNMLELEPFKSKKLKELSAGWKKTAIMGSVLIKSPEVIILDEPTANLDVKSKIEFLDILLKLKEIGVTLMITSHIIDELQNIADHLILIKQGEIVYNNVFNKYKESIMEVYVRYIDPKRMNLNELNKIYGGQDE